MNLILFLCLFIIVGSHQKSIKPTYLPLIPFPFSISFVSADDEPIPPPPQDLVPCQNILPGIERLNQGVDLNALDLFPTQLLSDNGYRRALFQLTCSQNLTWAHPTIKDYVYDRPDQLQLVTTVPAGVIDAETSFYSTAKDYKNDLSIKVGLGIDGDLPDIIKFLSDYIGDFSGSVSYKQMHQETTKEEKSVAMTSSTVSVLQAEFLESNLIRLNPNFLSQISRLPPTFNQSPQAYYDFLTNYGTHYFHRALFGGKLYSKTIMATDFYQSTDELAIGGELEVRLFKFFKVSGSVDYNSSTTNEYINNHTESHFYYFGGATNIDNTKSDYLSYWLNTVRRDPWIVSGQLVPIENLIADETIQAEVSRAKLFRQLKSHIKDIKKTLGFLGLKLSDLDRIRLGTIEKGLAKPETVNDEQLMDFAKVIAKLEDRVYEMKFREQLTELQDKLSDLHQFGPLGCKARLVDSLCYLSPLRKSILEERAALFKLQTKISSIIDLNEQANVEQMQDLLSEGYQMIKYHEKSPVNLCGKDALCLKCVNYNADCHYTKIVQKIQYLDENNRTSFYCQDPIIWNLIGYQPNELSKTCDFRENSYY